VLASWARWLLRFSLALVAVASRSEVAVDAEVAPERRVGWAVEAYPEMTSAEMEAVVRSMVRAGANVVWVGHNNPGITWARAIRWCEPDSRTGQWVIASTSTASLSSGSTVPTRR
jgi:hypothetical protein